MADLAGLTKTTGYQLGAEFDPSLGMNEYTLWQGAWADLWDSNIQSPGTQTKRGSELQEVGEVQRRSESRREAYRRTITQGFSEETAELMGLNQPMQKSIDNPEIDADRFKDQYKDLGIKWFPGMKVQEAEKLAQWKREELKLRHIINNSPNNLALSLVAGFAGQAIDPGNLILSAMIPGFGASTTLGGTVGRAAIMAAIDNTLAEGITYGGLQQTQYNMENYHPLQNIAFGTILGTGFGAAGHALSKMSARYAKKNPDMIETLNKELGVDSTQRVQNGDPADVGPIFDQHGFYTGREADFDYRTGFDDAEAGPREPGDFGEGFAGQGDDFGYRDRDAGEPAFYSDANEDFYQARQDFRTTPEETMKGVTSFDKAAEPAARQTESELLTAQLIDTEVESRIATGKIDPDRASDYRQMKGLISERYKPILRAIRDLKKC